MTNSIEPSTEHWDLPSSMTTTFDVDHADGRGQLLRLLPLPLDRNGVTMCSSRIIVVTGAAA